MNNRKAGKNFRERETEKVNQKCSGRNILETLFKPLKTGEHRVRRKGGPPNDLIGKGGAGGKRRNQKNKRRRLTGIKTNKRKEVATQISVKKGREKKRTLLQSGRGARGGGRKTDRVTQDREGPYWVPDSR